MIAICIVVGLTGCGNGAQEAASVDLEAVYDGYQQYLPEMFFPDEATLLNFLGIRTEDCAQ